MGLERLPQYLLDHKEISPEQLDEARRTQGFFGGQVASHLLKLGFVDEQTLGRALTDVTGAPYATRDHLTVLPGSVVGIVAAKLLEETAICPFEIVEGHLRLAMLNPRDAIALGKIRAASSYTIEPWVTCEYRLYQALERHYGIVPKGRRAITLAPPQRRTEPANRAELGIETTEPEMEIGLDGRPLDADITVEDHLDFVTPSGADSTPSVVENAPAVVPAAADDRGAPQEKEPLEKLDELLASARSRDDVAGAVLGFCRPRASRSALFAVGKGELRGLAGWGFEGRELTALTLPVEPLSIFHDVLESRELYFGVVPPVSANQKVFSALGGRLPSMATVLPILVKGRVASLLYLDDEDRPTSQPDIPLMRRVASKTGLAFEILLLRNKLAAI